MRARTAMSRRYAMRLRRPRFRGVSTPVATAGQSARRLAFVGGIAATMATLIWFSTTQTVAGQRLADLILFGRYASAIEVRGAAAETLATVSLVFIAIAVVGIATIALARGGMGLAVSVVVILAGSNLTAQALKNILERPRLLDDAIYATGNSFPSGHVTLAASFGLVCILAAPRGLRAMIATVAAVLSAAVGASAIVAGWHRLADVEGGILIALAWASLVTAVLVRGQGWMPRRSWGRGLGSSTTTIAGTIGLAAVLTGAVGIAVAVVDPTPLADMVADGTQASGTFVAAVAIAIGTSLLAFAAYVWAMRGVALELPG